MFKDYPDVRKWVPLTLLNASGIAQLRKTLFLTFSYNSETDGL